MIKFAFVKNTDALSKKGSVSSRERTILERLGFMRIFHRSNFLALFSERNRLEKSAGKFDS